MLKVRILIVIILIDFCCFNFSQAAINISNFKHLSTHDGLSQKSVGKIFQDSRGFLWFGTQEGLNRYDGREFTHFRSLKSNNRSISNDVIKDILEDANGNIWVATNRGLNWFDINHQSFHEINLYNRNKVPVHKINALFIDGTTLLIGTDGDGIISLDLLTYQQVKNDELSANLDVLRVRVIFKDSRDRTWIGSEGRGLWMVTKNKEQTYFSHDNSKKTSLSNDKIRSVFEDHRGQVWIGTRGGGVEKFNELTKQFIHYKNNPSNSNSISNNRIYTIFEDSNNTLWIGTDAGINIYQKESDDFKRVGYLASQKYGLSHNRVLDIYEDQGGLVWIGTLAGINVWDPITSKFAHYKHISERNNSLSNNTVVGFSESIKGNVFIATFGGGLDSIQYRTQDILRYFGDHKDRKLQELRLTALLYDSKERLWVGSATKGVRVFDKKMNVIANYYHSESNVGSLSANGITDIYEDRDGEVWIATYGAGLNRFNSSTKLFKKYRNDLGNNPQLSSNNIFQILEDDEGFIWLATDGGLSRLDKTTNEILFFSNIESNPESLSSDTAWSILQDSKGRFWIGTQGNGLNRWEAEDRRLKINRFTHYTIENGMNSSTVNGVVEDEEGYIWISTNKGISKLNPETDEIKHYNLSDEVHHNEFIQGAILKASDGRIYLGGENGISAFYPYEITENMHIPKIELTNVFSENREIKFNRSVENHKEVFFDHNDYLFNFEFSALDFSQPERNQYQYQLQGFDPDWINVGNLNRATYTNLPSGSYLFVVKASNNNGIWSEESIHLKVHIAPAPWASWWAFIIYATIFCLLLILFVHSQAKRIAGQELFKNKIIKGVDHEKHILEKENSHLLKKIENFQQHSSNDFATGMFNQKYFIDQAIFILEMLKRLKNNTENDIKLACIMINVESRAGKDKLVNKIDSKLLKEISSVIKDRFKSIQLIARWDTNDLALLQLSESKEDLLKLSKEICQLEFFNDIENEPLRDIVISLGYTMTPLRNGDENSYNWETMIKLTEHAMKNAMQSSNGGFIGLTECHQTLSSTLISSVMTSRLLSRTDVFKFDSNIQS